MCNSQLILFMWSSKDGLLSTRDSVRFTGINFLLRGKASSAKIKDQKMKILDNVKGTFTFRTATTVLIICLIAFTAAFSEETGAKR